MTKQKPKKAKWEEELNKQWGHLANCPLAKWHKWFIRYQIKQAKKEILERVELKEKHWVHGHLPGQTTCKMCKEFDLYNQAIQQTKSQINRLKKEL